MTRVADPTGVELGGEPAHGASPAGERGMATAEFAVAVPAVIAVLTLVLGGVQAGVAEVRCVDASRVGARMLARGDDPAATAATVRAAAPSGSQVRYLRRGETVTVTVSAPPGWVASTMGIGSLSSSSTAVDERDAP